MAKDKKKAKRIPKTIAGVTLPKELRRTGEAILDTVIARANSPEGKAAIAGGLSMAAAALASAAEKQRRAPAQPVTPATPATPANDAPGAPGIAGDRVGEVVNEAVERLLGGLFGKRPG